MPPTDSDQSHSAFLDVAANLLGVILIVTLFSLISLRHQATSASHPDAPARAEPRFVEPQRDLFPPFSRYFFVFDGRVLAWDQAAAVAALADSGPASHDGQLPQGRFEWVPEPLLTRDIDSFQLRFLLDRATLSATLPPWAAADLDRLLDELTQAAAARIAPVFIVHPDGMDLFAELYPRLQARGLRFRWFPQAPDEPLRIGRDPAQFTHHVIYW